MNKIKLLNYTSEVPVQKTIMEIEFLLAKAGATKIAKDYEGNHVSAFFFAIPTATGELMFRMPCDVDKVFMVLLGDIKKKRRGTEERVLEQASRVAWRILLDWIKTQIAMIQLQQVKPQQAFLAYAYDPRTRTTLYEQIERGGFKMLGSGDAR